MTPVRAGVMYDCGRKAVLKGRGEPTDLPSPFLFGTALRRCAFSIIASHSPPCNILEIRQTVIRDS